MKIELKELTPRQRDAWLMRYRYGWGLRHIAMRMGTSRQAVSALLLRAQIKAGLGRLRHIRIIRTKPTLIGCRHLSEFNNY